MSLEDKIETGLVFASNAKKVQECLEKRFAGSNANLLIKAVALANAFYDSKSERLTGVAMMVHEKTPAALVFKDISREAAATVALYPIKFSKVAEGDSVQLEAHMRDAMSKFSSMYSSSSDFRDQSLMDTFYRKSELSRRSRQATPLSLTGGEALPEDGVTEEGTHLDMHNLGSLGRGNASVSLVKGVSDQGDDVGVYLLCRGAFDTGVDEILKQSPKMTIGELYSNHLYKRAVEFSQKNLDRLALKVMNLIGAEPADSSMKTPILLQASDAEGNPSTITKESCKPLVTNQYNMIKEDSTSFQGAKAYVVYNRCIMTQNATSGILLGKGRHAGFALMNCGKKDETSMPGASISKNFDNEATLHAYPMGIPRIQSRSETPAGQKEYRGTAAVFNSTNLLDVRQLQGTYQLEAFSRNDFLQSLTKSGIPWNTQEKVNFRSYACFSSSPSTENDKYSVEEALRYHRNSQGEIEIRMDHPYCQERLMKDFNKLREQTPSLKLSEFLLREGESSRQTCFLKADLVEKALKSFKY